LPNKIGVFVCLRSWSFAGTRVNFWYKLAPTNTFLRRTNLPLTDAKLRTLKPRASSFKLSDSEGLYVLVAPDGSKLWRLAYRFLGKQKTLALGRYPDVTLLAARRARDEAKQLLKDGTDPSSQRKVEKRKQSIAAATTFEAIADEWFDENQTRWVKTYASDARTEPPHVLKAHDGRFKGRRSYSDECSFWVESRRSARNGCQSDTPSSLNRLVCFGLDLVGQWRHLGEWHNHQGGYE